MKECFSTVSYSAWVAVASKSSRLWPRCVPLFVCVCFLAFSLLSAQFAFYLSFSFHRLFISFLLSFSLAGWLVCVDDVDWIVLGSDVCGDFFLCKPKIFFYYSIALLFRRQVHFFLFCVWKNYFLFHNYHSRVPTRNWIVAAVLLISRVFVSKIVQFLVCER